MRTRLSEGRFYLFSSQSLTAADIRSIGWKLAHDRVAKFVPPKKKGRSPLRLQ